MYVDAAVADDPAPVEPAHLSAATIMLQARTVSLPADAQHHAYEELELEVSELTAKMVSMHRSYASTSGRVPLPFLPKKPELNSTAALLELEARRLKAQRMGACCFLDGDLQQIWELLQQHSTYDHEPCINYDGFAQVGARCRALLGPEVAQHFRPSSFMRLERDQHGRVPVQLVMHYLSARSGQLHARLGMAQLADPDTASLNEQQLRSFLRSYIAGIPCLADLQEDQVAAYCQVAARKFMVFDARRGRVALRELLSSAVWQELQELKMSPPDDPMVANNWFSLQSVGRVLSTFSAWDVDQSGGLSLQEFCAINSAGTMSVLVLRRVFEEHVSKAREPHSLLADEMSLLEFVDFVLAWDCRHHAAVIPYFFSIFDLQKKGSITPGDLYMFFREVHGLLLARGEHDVPIADVVDEVMDMARPASPAGITLQDMQACRLAGTIFSILSDVVQFIDYNNRENALHASDNH